VDGWRRKSGVSTDAQQFFNGRAGQGLHVPQFRQSPMTAKREPIEYADASIEVRAVYDDIMATRKTDWVNNFWKVLAHDPPTLRRIWANIKEVMGPGTLDPLTKELLYVAVSASNGCRYCIASHGAAARKKGMTEEQYSELLAIVGLANETNRLVTALDVAVDPAFL
jgi:AhpD family alkylhydroperoxidase